MRLAEPVSVEIAEVILVPVSRVEGIREKLLRPGKIVLAVQRFDRDGERRIYMEDFAQILGAVGNKKYSKTNIETMVRLAARFTPDPAATVLEMVRRIVGRG